MPPPPVNRLNRDETPGRDHRDRGDAPAPAGGAPARDRGDACPGALRLHTADDGALARIRVPAGVLDARQAYALADAADRLGDGALDITSRGNLQLRGLGASCGGELAALLDTVGLLPAPGHERVRNIVASPLSGLDGRGHLDVQPLARALDAELCASARATALSGRFLFALDDGRGDMADLAADVTLIAERAGAAAGGAPGVVVRAGEPSGVRVAAPDGPRMMIVAAEAFLDAVDASGTGAWRVRELPPAQGPSGEALAARAAQAGIRAEAAPVLPVAAVPGQGPVPVPGAYGCVLAPLGRLTSAQWRLLARTAERQGTGELRVTPWRGVVLPGVPADRLAALAVAGLVTDPASPWRGVGACTGRPGCGKALSDVRADAAELVGVTRLLGAAQGPGGGLPVYLSGCARRCGHPRGAWADVVATGDGQYDLAVHGVPGPGGAGLGLDALAGALAAVPAAAGGGGGPGPGPHVPGPPGGDPSGGGPSGPSGGDRAHPLSPLPE
ncbi:precorrin-3B synthase [Streptomyces sp. NPDC005805]|uniref:precorrin-3B synthase n=1 Tax=Streptomyces sp. NPDC005805 TaxID=3157068 RepID=UPI0033E94D91